MGNAGQWKITTFSKFSPFLQPKSIDITIFFLFFMKSSQKSQKPITAFKNNTES